jgi:RecA-family ATPase
MGVFVIRHDSKISGKDSNEDYAWQSQSTVMIPDFLVEF